MGVLNVTPDSFSDGGIHNASVDAAVTRIQEMVEEGADIIDIGGQSTRPGAEIVSLDQELSRVIPVISAARALGVTACISIDTFRAEVARQAVAAGADMINDVSGGLLDDDMLATAAQLMVPICLMHYRGDPATMLGLAHYPAGGVLATVAEELEGRVAAALRAGVPRWNIVVDPGIGFAKTAEQVQHRPSIFIFTLICGVVGCFVSEIRSHSELLSPPPTRGSKPLNTKLQNFE
jgi:dihydroneopterin aldolase/2-amino-4-hydroxy-6-hydroxymethyldihydropteridine diphosphokinase/dihydropteroate synthase